MSKTDSRFVEALDALGVAKTIVDSIYPIGTHPRRAARSLLPQRNLSMLAMFRRAMSNGATRPSGSTRNIRIETPSLVIPVSSTLRSGQQSTRKEHATTRSCSGPGSRRAGVRQRRSRANRRPGPRSYHPDRVGDLAPGRTQGCAPMTRIPTLDIPLSISSSRSGFQRASKFGSRSTRMIRPRQGQ